MTEGIDYSYRCRIVSGIEPEWNELDGVTLTGTEFGGRPRLATIVKACRTDAALHVRFECRDDRIVASYTKHDDPIYEQDVVEVFIDEAGEGRTYKEFEFSPAGVTFDALIEKEEGHRPRVHTEWDVPGLTLDIAHPEDELYIYSIAIPLSAFDEVPIAGTEWRVNFYRIDDD